MSTLFLVGGVKESVLNSTLEEQFPDLFDRTVTLQSVDELLLRLYQERVAGCAKGSAKGSVRPWSFETGVTLIVHRSPHGDNAGTSRDLGPLLQHFFPCFNLLAVKESQLDQMEQTVQLLTQLQGYSQQLCRDRIARMAHWMYRSEPSAGFYQMVQHLRSASLHRSHSSVIPRAIRGIDFASLLGLTPQRESELWEALDCWSFQPHTMQTDELVICSFLLLRRCASHAKTAAQENRLLLLLFTLEASYHQVNRFHNFRHAVDVMQAAWQLSKRLLQDPLQILLITLAALGHDVGHPGCNNQLLCKYDSPIATHYRKKSVLEHMHTDLFGDLLLEHWPQLISRSAQGRHNMEHIAEAIMATDMALHGDYVRQLQASTHVADLGSLSSLILKAADISNVTRPLNVSAQWAALITLEFEDCALLDLYEDAAAGDDEDLQQRQRRQSQQRQQQHSQCQRHQHQRNDCPELEHGVDPDFDFRSATPEALTDGLPTIPAGQIFFIDTFAEQFFSEFCHRFPTVGFLAENVKANRESWVRRSKNLPIIPPF